MAYKPPEPDYDRPHSYLCCCDDCKRALEQHVDDCVDKLLEDRFFDELEEREKEEST